MDSTVRSLGVELEDALAIAEAIEIQAFGPFDTDGPKWTLGEDPVAAAQPVKADGVDSSCFNGRRNAP